MDELAKNVGADKSVQNPQKAIEQAQGTYKDAASELSDGDRFPNMTEGPQPSPFKSLR